MSVVTLATHAMATRFEAVLHGGNPVSLRAAGEEAMAEIQRLEAQLSLFCPESEIAHVNARAALEPVRVTPEVFALLAKAKCLTELTHGAFDITIAPLLRCWGFLGGNGQFPTDQAIEKALTVTGMHLVTLDPQALTVQFQRPGVMLDLGAVGKGYAVERAIEILRECGVQSALFHGGTSTIYGLGAPPGENAWKIALEDGILPEQHLDQPFTVALRDEALSVSAVWGKFFRSKGEVFGHVLDPATGRPARACILAAVVLPSATETDALSTALLVRGAPANEDIRRAFPMARSLWWSGRPGDPAQAQPSLADWVAISPSANLPPNAR